MQFNVSTTGLNVTLNDFELTLVHPTTIDLIAEGFLQSEIADSIELQQLIDTNVLSVTNELSEPVTNLDLFEVSSRLDQAEADIVNTGPNILADNNTFTGTNDFQGATSISGINYPTVDGSPGDVMLTDGAGNLTLQQLQVGYSEFPIWAEENGALTANNNQWSFGNGSTGNFGITVPSLEVYALSFESETSGTNVTIDLMQNFVVADSVTFIGPNGYATLTTPISFTEGQVLGFRTASVVGSYNDARVTAWCRKPLLGLQGIQGIQGLPGIDGVGGVPNKFARVTCSGNTNVNAATYTQINLNSVISPDTIGASILSNEIVLPSGSYIIRGVFSVSSSVQRSNQEVRLLIDGAEFSSEFGEGYIRSTGGHNESKISITDIISIPSTANISFEMRQISAAGTVALDGARSKIIIHQVA